MCAWVNNHPLTKALFFPFYTQRNSSSERIKKLLHSYIVQNRTRPNFRVSGSNLNVGSNRSEAKKTRLSNGLPGLTVAALPTYKNNFNMHKDHLKC